MLGTLPCPTLPYPNPEPNPEPPHPAPHHLTQPQPLHLPYPTPPHPTPTLLLSCHTPPCHAEKYSCRLFGWTETCILPGFHGNLFLELDATANIYHYNIPWEFKPNVISRHACPTIPYPTLPLYTWVRSDVSVVLLSISVAESGLVLSFRSVSFRSVKVKAIGTDRMNSVKSVDSMP